MPGLVDTTWSNQALWDWFVDAPTKILVTLVVAVVIRWLLNRAIRAWVGTAERRHAKRSQGIPGRAERAIAQAAGLDHERYVQRTRTMATVMRSVVSFTVGGVATLTILAIMGIPLAPLLASAGVGGVALGFGAQSLVKDFLSGIFMILEDQYGVGDVVDVGTVSGSVEDVSLRVTRIRDADGVAWYVRNGEIVRVGNKSQGWSTAIVDVPVSNAEPLDSVLRVIRTAIDAMGDHAKAGSDTTLDSRILEPPTVVGVESLTVGAVTIRITAKCVANANWQVQRDLRERIKLALDAAGIEPPAVPSPGGLS